MEKNGRNQHLCVERGFKGGTRQEFKREKIPGGRKAIMASRAPGGYGTKAQKPHTKNKT